MSTQDTKQLHWIEVSPGIYSRLIPQAERQVDAQFIESIASAVDSTCLREIIMKTEERLLRANQLSGK